MVSNKNISSSGKRPYTLKARAQRHEEVHRRITLATVYLHGTIGPAKTTMGEIAKRAGVRRATVYNHFSNDFELIDACSSHWFGENQPPDPAVWVKIADPGRRVLTALEAMYEYYHNGQKMLDNVLRDAPAVPALNEILKLKWWPMIGGIVDLLAEGWDSYEEKKSSMDTGKVPNVQMPQINKGGDLELRASLRVVLDFFTWQKLTDLGLSNKKAAQLATMWVNVSRKVSP